MATIPERLRWIADTLEEAGDQNPSVRMGLSQGLQVIADEVWPVEQDDGTWDKLGIDGSGDSDG